VSRFAPGDILLAASDIDDREIDLRNHRGPGRVLHLDGDFDPKGELWTGEVGLLVGLAQDPADGTVYGADPTGRHVFRFDAEGVCARIGGLPDRPWGTVAFGPDGGAYLGVHSQRGPAPADAYGGSKLMRFEPASGAILDAYDIETDGGRSGWHGLTSLAFADEGRVAVYCSEAGRRILRYDLEARRQLDDAWVFGEDDPWRAYSVAVLPDGRLMVAAGGACLILAGGRIEARWPADPAKGWTRVTESVDGETFFFNNFLEGVIERRSLADGAVLRRHDIGRKCVLCGVVEIEA
jgi:hypothetical protein